MLSKDALQIIHKTREDYNRIAKHFASTRQNAGELEKFKPFIKNGQNILDWGCGHGKLLYILRGTSARYYGIDQSDELLKIARKNFKKEIKAGWVKFYSTAKKEKKFPYDFFDLVFLAASFHHLPDNKTRLKLLKKTYQEMKLGARIIITVWNLKSSWALKKFKKDWKRLKNNDYLIPWKNQEGEVMAERYYHYFTKQELKEMLEKSGFTIEEMYYSKGNERVPQKEARNLVVIAIK